jgi:hypothetical protein
MAYLQTLGGAGTSMLWRSKHETATSQPREKPDLPGGWRRSQLAALSGSILIDIRLTSISAPVVTKVDEIDHWTAQRQREGSNQVPSPAKSELTCAMIGVFAPGHAECEINGDCPGRARCRARDMSGIAASPGPSHALPQSCVFFDFILASLSSQSS